MPLSEVPQATTRGNLESAQSRMTNCSPDLTPLMPDHGCVELLWENGQIVMQGQSNRPNKRSFTNTLSSHTGRFQERDNRDAVIPKAGHFGTDSMVNDFPHSVPSGNIGLDAQDDEMVPWLNYSIEDSLQTDYYSEFLSEFSGFNPNSLSTHNHTMPAYRSSNVEHGHASRAPTGGSEASRIRTSQLFQLPQQCQSSVPITKSRAADFGVAGNSSTHQGCGNLPDKNLQKQAVGTSKPPHPSIGMGLMNFPHFSRPAARVKSNLKSVDRLRNHEKASNAAFSKSVESTVIDSTSGLKSLTVSGPPKMELRSSDKPSPHEVVSVEKPEAICQEDTSRNNINTRSPDHINHQSSSAVASVANARHEVEKGPEAVVASSSVCSVNSAGAESNEPKHITKRKNREGDESGYHSEDLEDESVGLKKSTTGRVTSAKRGRAAEVHNLSERRRRDRINEKMRALQELIPNCNKVDKASMLDEAIEYLKTLQLQVQIMSMGSGLCMPPMMLPAGMQHLRPHPMAHFSPMGLNMGMGMGLGFGMGMLDMNGPPGCQLIPVPPMHGPQFTCPSMPMASSLHAMQGSTGLQMFGIPRQNVPMPHAPPFGSLPGLSEKVNSAPGATTSPLLVADIAPSSDSKNQEQQNVNLETSTQAAKESFKQSTRVQMGNQTLHVGRN